MTPTGHDGGIGSLVQVATGTTGKPRSFEGRGAISDPYYHHRACYVLWRIRRTVVRQRGPALPYCYLSDSAPRVRG